MNYIAGTILLVYNLEEKESFDSFLGIMLKFNLLDLYKDNFTLLLKYISSNIKNYI